MQECPVPSSPSLDDAALGPLPPMLPSPLLHRHHHYFCAVLGMNEEVGNGGEVDREERSKKIAGGLANAKWSSEAETEDEKKAEMVSGDVVM